MESCHSDRRSERARALGVPTAYPTDLYTFMGFISTKRKIDHAAAYAARAVYGHSKVSHHDAVCNKNLRVQPLP